MLKEPKWPRVQHSFESEIGIKAPLLSQRGVTGPKGIFWGVPGGIFRHLSYEDFDPDWLTVDLGKKWNFTGLSLKPYSSCKYTHSFIDATIEIVRKHQVDPKDIDRIHCIGSAGARMTIEPREAKWNPNTVGEACYSTPYAVATAAINGKVFLDDFTEEEVKRSDKRDLMKRVTVDIDPDIQTQFDGFTVNVTLKDGRTYSNTSQYVWGHPKKPMRWDDVIEKFWRCVPYSAKRLSEKKLQRAVTLCTNMEQIDDMTELIESLTP